MAESHVLVRPRLVEDLLAVGAGELLDDDLVAVAVEGLGEAERPLAGHDLLQDLGVHDHRDGSAKRHQQESDAVARRGRQDDLGTGIVGRPTVDAARVASRVVDGGVGSVGRLDRGIGSHCEEGRPRIRRICRRWGDGARGASRREPLELDLELRVHRHGPHVAQLVFDQPWAAGGCRDDGLSGLARDNLGSLGSVDHDVLSFLGVGEAARARLPGETTCEGHTCPDRRTSVPEDFWAVRVTWIHLPRDITWLYMPRVS